MKQRICSNISALDTGSWGDGLDLKTKDVAPGTQLAVSRTVSKNRFHIRLFYQLIDNTLSQTVYESDKGQWAVSPIESESDEFKACPNSSLAAVSSGGTRLFYQNSSGDIVEIQESNGLWTDRKLASVQRENISSR
jgi:hypothetical protein